MRFIVIPPITQALSLTASFIVASVVAQEPLSISHPNNTQIPVLQIHWQPNTATLIQRGAAYGRMARLSDDAILCAYSRRGTIYTRRSADNGKSWQAEAVAVEYAHGQATNAELLVLSAGRVLLIYNERPSDGQSHYAIGIGASDDGGRTWQDLRRVYTAGTDWRTGCWEPAAVELPSGEIQLFFANEAPYRTSDEQQITRLRSLDGATTWLQPQAVAFRPDHRDGMPVPLLLADGKRIALAIEDDGLAGRFKPTIISLSTTVEPGSLPVCADDSRRQAAFAEPLSRHVYAGAPYLIQLPSGETVLSVQSTEGRGTPHDHTNSHMVVYIGDATAHNFTNRTVPFKSLTTTPGLWNAIFVKDAETITAISATTVNGVRGVWAVDGHVTQSP